MEPSAKDNKRKQQTHVHFSDVEDEGQRNENEFDPERRREAHLPLTNFETFLHLLKSILGTGILAMPKAFSYAGWIFGIIGTAIIAMVSTYCVHLLIKSQNEICRRHRVDTLTYSETSRKSILEGPVCCVKFARGFGFLTSFILVVDQIGTCCVYIIFVASNVKDVVDQYVEPLDIRVYMAFLLPPLLLLNYIRNLKYLAPFSTLANLIVVVSFGITLYYVLHDLPSISNRKEIGSATEIPLFVGMVLFSMEAIGVVLPLRNDMKRPKSFGGLFGILNQVMFILTVAYIIVGFLGYMKYGEDTKGSITLNLPNGEALAQSVRVMLSCSVLLSHALQCYVIIDVIWNENLAYKYFRSRWKYYLEYITRTVIVALTILLAVAIPNLELFISLVGALCVTLLAVLFPVIIETFTYWYTTEGFRFYVMCSKNFLLALFGIFGLTVGVYTSMVEIICAL